MKKCPRCGQWHLKEVDTFCSYCGALPIDLHLVPEAIALYGGEGKQCNKVVLSNKGTGSEDVKILFGGEKAPYLEISPAEPFKLDANKEKSVEIRLVPAKLPADFRSSRVTLLCQVGSDPKRSIPLTVDVYSAPRPVADPPKIVFPDVEVGKAVQGRKVAIWNRGGLPLAIKGLALDGCPEMRAATVPPPFPPVKPGEKFEFTLFWDSPNNPPDKDARVRVQFQGNVPDLHVPVAANLFKYSLSANPPQIVRPNTLCKESFSEKVILSNDGTRAIEVTRIESDQSWIHVVSNAKSFTLLAPGTGGGTPVGGTTFATKFPFEIVCHPQELAEGAHNGTVKVRTTQSDVEVSISVRIQVVRPRECLDYIGIDFGTTNSVVAIWDNKSLCINVVEEINPVTKKATALIPSVLVFSGGGDNYKIGLEAEAEALFRPENTVRSIKRIMGYSNHREFFNRRFYPEDLAALIIKKLVLFAERRIFETGAAMAHAYQNIRRAILTVPANFFDLQIRSILKAAKEAGLETEENGSGAEFVSSLAEGLPDADGTVRNSQEDVYEGVIIDEPSAAALFYFNHLAISQPEIRQELVKKLTGGRPVHFLIFDYGGGTLDVSVARIGLYEGNRTGINVLANKGDNDIGGDTIDLIVMKKMLDQCRDKHPKFSSEVISCLFNELEERRFREKWDVDTWAQILGARSQWKEAAEKLKISLSNAVRSKASRDDMSTDFVIKGINIIQVSGGKVSNAAEAKTLVDGNFVQRIRYRDLVEWLESEGILGKCRELIMGALTLAKLKPEQIDFLIHTGRSSLMPEIRKLMRNVFPSIDAKHDILEEDQLKVCVAKGAALYGRLKQGMGGTVFFVKGGRILPHSYGISTQSPLFGYEIYNPIIPLGEKYPVRVEKHFSDVEIGRHWVSFHFYQYSGDGESGEILIQGNEQIRHLGSIQFDPSADGIPGADIILEVDANRKLEVMADGKAVPIQPEQLKEEQRWVG